MGRLLTLNRARGGGGGGTEVVIPRVGSGSMSEWAPTIASQFTPASTVALAGVNDVNQLDIALSLAVWQVSADGSALLASSAPVSRVGGVHEARLAEPFTLVSGVGYRIGWVAETSGNARAVNSSSQTWEGFTVTRMLWSASRVFDAPTSSQDSYRVPFDLVLLE